MTVVTNSKSALVAGQVTTIQAQANGYTDFSVGAVLLAVIEAFSDVALWIQALILSVLALTRASTSQGSDLDSWMADFGFTRLGAVSAIGSVTFSRISATTQVVVPIGSTVETSDGTEQFTVSVDTTNPAYNSGLDGYVMAIGTYSVLVPVLCSTPGSGGNVVASAVDTITSSIPGVDYVTNPSAFTNGLDAETDPQFRARFIQWLLSLEEGTPAAVLYAAQYGAGVSGILEAKILENETYELASLPGFFTVVVDDGTGDPTGTELTEAANAVNLVRPICSTFGVYGPTIVDVTITMTITVAGGYTPSTIASTVQTALIAFVNDLADATNLPWSKLAQVAYDASPAVTNVTDVLLNGGTADVAISPIQTIKETSVTVTPA